MEVTIDARKGGGGQEQARTHGGGGGGGMNKKSMEGLFFYVGMQSFLSTWGPFSPCGGSLSPHGGLFLRMGGGGGHFWACLPLTIFLW